MLTTNEIAKLSADEIMTAVASSRPRVPAWFRAALAVGVKLTSHRLARQLAAFDTDIARRGLSAAAAAFLARMGARTRVAGAPPRRERGALVVMNHPGAYDALAMMASLERDDVLFLARDRRFLRALPNLHAHLAFVGERGATSGLKSALRQLGRGGVVVQLGAGAIEADARFTAGERCELAPWPAGSGLLADRAARIGADVIAAFVSGVHSPRAKRLRIVRWAEARAITTVGPLVQATVPGFRDVEVDVRFGEPFALERGALSHEARAATLRSAVAALSR